MLRIAILDLYEGHANQGMRCIHQIIEEWTRVHHIETEKLLFDVRQNNEVPDMSYDVYISSGGPGSPLGDKGYEWEKTYFNWLEEAENWNAGAAPHEKKRVFFICHSYQLACRYWSLGTLGPRRKKSFGVYPVHVTLEGQHDEHLRGLKDPFYVVDSREYQVTHPDTNKMQMMGSQILCIEKYRPHIDDPQAVMCIRFNEYMIGTQFHPEADAIGMSIHLQTEEKKKMVIDEFGEEKWLSMVEHLNDPDKIMWTYKHILPNFLSEAASQVKPVLAL